MNQQNIERCRELHDNMLAWAEARNLVKGSTPKKQFCKLMSEVGELGDNIVKNNGAGIADDIGDAIVVMTIIAAQNGQAIADWPKESLDELDEVESLFIGLTLSLGLMGDCIDSGFTGFVDDHIGEALDSLYAIAFKFGYTLDHCMSVAYDEIKDRKGVMYNGTFIKESDAQYQSALVALGHGGA